ncbi:putative zinc finger protein At1g68190 [Lycium barbarum]|uniref:putative zinc finger protein At1g68190 n=1 Tax=Lycium barbarum TaxID=112863 RepID=UPI00293F2E8A|nr:putative zinc finger protein At1g68190 [Lycium barbarum]XP_060185054.1 putative zinc finger protein At1g68190 [Lycium barbarum]XP_060185055.1 putative zinc finger protein At1g68190 [Lycium barbarum]XP_060185056.1 putative zinc finger protein At1g68190 [Lycium barbarum]
MEMEKTCEFCMLLKPVVYCEADAAHLCLSCDAKVHSANALSNRHPRTLVCEPCGFNLAYIRCSDHQMFMCRDCDRRHHDDLSSQHQRKVITCYMGSPSAKDLAALWGFGLKDLENTPPDQFISTANGKVNGAKVTPKFVKRSHSSAGGSAESEVGSTSNYTKAFCLLKRRENTSLILQQILDLERLQLTEGSNNLTSGESKNNLSSLKNGASWDMHNKFERLQKSLDLGPELQDWGSTHESSVAGSFPLSLPDGDSFWECKSPVQSSQLWPQNLQDLGAYAELECFDNSNMPDVDLTFQNFEELFGEEQDLNNTLLEEDMTCSYMDNNLPIDRSDYSYVKRVKDISKASSVHTAQSTHFGQGHSEHIPTIKDCPPPIRTNFSSLSFSASRLSSESSGNEYADSPTANEQEVSCNSQIDSKENLLAMHKEKKKARLYEKQARNTPRRARTNLKKQPIRGRVLKAHSYESDAVTMS